MPIHTRAFAYVFLRLGCESPMLRMLRAKLLLELNATLNTDVPVTGGTRTHNIMQCKQTVLCEQVITVIIIEF